MTKTHTQVYIPYKGARVALKNRAKKNKKNRAEGAHAEPGRGGNAPIPALSGGLGKYSIVVFMSILGVEFDDFLSDAKPFVSVHAVPAARIQERVDLRRRYPNIVSAIQSHFQIGKRGVITQ